MKIKLAILENDQSYLNRIVSVFSTKYADKFQIYSFTSQDAALAALEKEKIDTLIAGDSFEIDVTKLPKRCSFAYFVDSVDIETVNEQRAICKFQKADLIYKQILSIYSENAGNLTGLKLTDEDCRIITFSSPCGGTGTSTVAASCALYFAAQRKKTLYLSFDNFASNDIFFNGEGQFDMSDVVFAIKSKKANLAMKLESYVKQDPRGVYFFSKPKFALDMLELTEKERIQFLSDIQTIGSYEYIIVDTNFALDSYHFDIYNKSHSIVFVSDGSEIANDKVINAYNAIVTLQQNSDIPMLNRTSIIYNKFSSKSGKTIEEIDIKNAGGAPKFEQATTAQIMGQLCTMDMFEKLN